MQACNEAKDSVQKGMKRSGEAKSGEEQKKSVFDRLKKPADRQPQKKDNEGVSTETKEPINPQKRKYPGQQSAVKQFKEDEEEVKDSTEERKVRGSLSDRRCGAATGRSVQGKTGVYTGTPVR